MIISQYLPKSFEQFIKEILSIIPPERRLGKRFNDFKSFIDKAQWWDRAEIENWQLDRLRSILKYAYHNVEGYYFLYKESGIHPDDIQSLEHLKFLPFVSKDLLRDNLKAFTSRAIPKWDRVYVTTGGSTGIPFGFFRTRLNFLMEKVFIYSGWERVGWKTGEGSAVLRGAFIGCEKAFTKYDRYNKELLLSSYFLTDKNYRNYIEKIKEYAPPNLQAYPSIATILADLILTYGDAGKIKFKTILLGSENIYDWQKEKITAAFPEAKLFSWYGHAEQVILAPACEYSDQYHIWPFYGMTEVLNKNNEPVSEGETGELIGTSFWNYGTPFIRYRTMDKATLGRSICEKCGRKFQLLEKIEGRLQEIIVTKTGRYISMTAINMHDGIFDKLKQFQFCQEEVGKITFKYVPKHELAANDLNNIRNKLLVKIGNDIELDLLSVTDIPRTSAGKFRFLQQKLSIRYGDK